MKNVICTAVLLSVMSVASVTTAHAFGMPKLPGLGGGSNAAAADPAQIVKSLKDAVVDLEYANAAYLDALNRKIEADEARRNADGLKSGSVGLKEAIELSTATSDKVMAEVKKKSAESVVLDETSKSKFSQGLIHHVAGTVSGVKGGKQLKSALNAPQNLASLAPLTEFPGLIQKWTGSTEQVFAYLSSNGIDVSQAKATISKGMAD